MYAIILNYKITNDMIKTMMTKTLDLAQKMIIYQLIFILLAGFIAVPAQAQDPITISNIVVDQTDRNATISWSTNLNAISKLEYGIITRDYKWSVQSNQKKTDQAMTITGLFPETTYYFRITAITDNAEVTSFEQSFKTTKASDNKSPEISRVAIPYITGTTATIQWLTDEPATSEVDYGRTDKYGSNKTNRSRVRVHDITLTGLQPSTNYHFVVKSKDEDNNISRYEDMTFRTHVDQSPEQSELLIYNVQPSAENNLQVSQDSAVISWWTNKVAEGWVRYGTNISYGKTVATDAPRDFSKSVTLIGLEPGKTYYFEIQAKDVFGKQIKSSGHSFTTKSPTPAGSGNTFVPTPQVLGAASCDIDLKTDLGYFGLYYNLTEGHPDVELYKGKAVTWTKIGRQNDWYNPEYFAFSRVDTKLDFGSGFFPVDEGKPGDPYHFAVNWRAIIEVPQDDFYTYSITSDDDSWILVDGQVISDLSGVHKATTDKGEVQLTAGYHELEIYYAERSRRSSAMTFKPDSRLKFHPLPEGCTIGDVLSYQDRDGLQFDGTSGVPLYGSGGQQYYNPTNNETGQVLGVSNTDQPPVQPQYVCNPNSGYTKFKALYKTTSSPDVWAILETGQRHYITSPQSFAEYGCSWSEVKTVSEVTLNRYAIANLVRTPANATVYHLFSRPDHQWLKINIPSPTVFISYPNNFWGNVARINQLDISAYPDVQLIKKTGDSKTYKIEGHDKRLIPTEAIFIAHNFEHFEVVEINQMHFDSYQTESDLQ